jgi:type VI secretion system protein ImpJ
MSAYNKVVWSEGLFLQPHHLQQQDRYLERYVEQRCRSLVPFSWGFSEVELERDLLSIGKLGLRRAAGVFPDGTPMRMPEDDPLPEPLSVSEEVRDQVVYLSVPLRRVGAQDVDRAAGQDALARHMVREWEARDVTGASGTTATVEVGALRSRLLLASDTTEAYACIPLAHITECRPDKQVVLEDRFIPTVLRSGAATRLATFTTELLGLLHQRGEELGGRAIASSRGSSDEFVSYLFLQAVNRYEPLLAHLDESGALHPETLYRLFVMAAGELATFSTSSKRAPTLPPYRHHQLRESFEPVMAALRAAFSVFTPQSAIPIPLETRKYGVRLGVAPDRNLYDTAVFVRAARADVPAEDLRRRFPGQLKIGPVEQIQNLVNLALPGVPVTPMPTAPRQLPFHAGFVYFELDQTNKLWALMKTSGGVALHVAGDFPGLTLEFWAIRG